MFTSARICSLQVYCQGSWHFELWKSIIIIIFGFSRNYLTVFRQFSQTFKNHSTGLYIYSCPIPVENLTILNIVCGTPPVHIHLIGMLHTNCVKDHCIYSLHVSPTHCPEQSSEEPAGPRLWPSSSLWWLSGGGSFGKSTPLTPGTSSSFYYQFSSDNCWLWSFKFCYIYTCIAKTSRISVALSCEHLFILYLSMGVSIPATNYLPSAVHWPALQLMWSHPLPHHLGLLRCLKNQTQYILYPLSMHRLHDYKM